MTSALTTIDLSSPTGIPAYLQAYSSGLGKNLLVSGGLSGNRIGFKGCRFRLVVNGQEEGVVEENYLDTVIVGAAPGVSRIYYQDAYDSDVKVAPTCYSKDGTAPADDVKNKQSATCAKCPMNEKGSRVTEGGQKTRACSFFKRLAVVLPSDPTRVFRVDAKGMSIFGEGKPAQNKFSIQEYGKKLATRGIEPTTLVTRMSFDTDESVPKLLLSPNRWLTAEEAQEIAAVAASDEVKQVLDVTSATVDLSGEVTPQEEQVAAEPEAVAEPVKAGPTLSKAAAPAAQVAAPAPKAGPTVVKKAPAAAAPAVRQVAQPAVVVPADDADLADILAQLEAE